MPLVTGLVVLVFGGLTLYLQDETFIKLKPTIIYALFAAVLLGGLVRPAARCLRFVFDSVFQLTEEGWRKLTMRWALFFVVHGDPERDRLALGLDRYLGRVQDLRLPAAHDRLRAGADAALDAVRIEEKPDIRRPSGAKPAKHGGPRTLSQRAPSRFRPCKPRERLLVDRPHLLVGDLPVAADQEGLRHAVDAPLDRRAPAFIDADRGERIAEAPRKRRAFSGASL